MYEPFVLIIHLINIFKHYKSMFMGAQYWTINNKNVLYVYNYLMSCHFFSEFQFTLLSSTSQLLEKWDSLRRKGKDGKRQLYWMDIASMIFMLNSDVPLHDNAGANILEASANIRHI